MIVFWETAWRWNQKEPDLRTEMAEREIRRVFQSPLCGRTATTGVSLRRENWGRELESSIAGKASKEGFDTVVFIRIEELTPLLAITFSLPFLWSGFSEADFRIRVVSLKYNRVLMDERIVRMTGGPFQLRPATWASDELRQALQETIERTGRF